MALSLVAIPENSVQYRPTRTVATCNTGKSSLTSFTLLAGLGLLQRGYSDGWRDVDAHRGDGGAISSNRTNC